MKKNFEGNVYEFIGYSGSKGIQDFKLLQLYKKK